MSDTDAQAADILKRLAAFRSAYGDNTPVGIPERVSNTDETDHKYPHKNVLPNDKGWSSTSTVTGSGRGPIL